MPIEIVEQRTDRCLYCEQTRGDHNDFDCETFVDPSDMCSWCVGTGHEDTDDDFTDGRRCRYCAGQGWVKA